MDPGAPRLEFLIGPLAEGRPEPDVKAGIDATDTRGLKIHPGARKVR
jgi:hypothetical protein